MCAYIDCTNNTCHVYCAHVLHFLTTSAPVCTESSSSLCTWCVCCGVCCKRISASRPHSSCSVTPQMSVLQVLSLLVERMGTDIRPFLASLTQYLPLLWLESSDHNMLRCAILSTLVHIVKVATLNGRALLDME